MSGLAQRAFVLVAFSLLASATTTYAECAWVLWEQISAEPWSLKDGFSDADSCKRALRSGIKKSVSAILAPKTAAVTPPS